MADLPHDHHHDHEHSHPTLRLAGIDGAVLGILLIPLVLLVLDRAQVLPTLRFAGQSMLTTGGFILFAVGAVTWLKATGAEALLARAFEGREVRMIVMAAVLGGLSPFCSCEVIPFIAALLAVGAPLSAVMAFWLASPLMDPAMFLITAGTLGLPFALAKTAAAVSMGMAGGFIVKSLKNTPILANPLRRAPKVACGCGTNDAPFQGHPVWRFWEHAERRETFRKTAVDNILFLGKWLLLAYLIEALMLHYVSAEAISSVLGGAGIWPIVLGALVGAPAYLNGYAAVPLIDALLQQGMSNGAAMSFALAGGVTCIPAAVAVWALVKPRIFGLYLGIAFVASISAGMIWSAIA